MHELGHCLSSFPDQYWIVRGFQCHHVSGTAALHSSYIISIACVRLRRWRNQPLPPARWSIGRFTPFVDTVSILVLIIIWVFSLFPLIEKVDPTTIDWSVVIFGGVILLSLVYYQLHAKRVYKGPVTRVNMMAG